MHQLKALGHGVSYLGQGFPEPSREANLTQTPPSSTCSMPPTSEPRHHAQLRGIWAHRAMGIKGGLVSVGSPE